MWSIRFLLLPLLALPLSVFAQRSECPWYSGAASNILVNARLFDGPVTDQVELVPDNEHGATWNVTGYKATSRKLILLCEYKNHASIEVPVDYSANRCYFKGKRRRSAWCGT